MRLLIEGVLIQGRMYMTRRRVAFYSNMIGIVHRVSKHLTRGGNLLEDIDLIRKRMTAGFIPNAIEIITDSTSVQLLSDLSLFFQASYLAMLRDKLMQLWKASTHLSYFSNGTNESQDINVQPSVSFLQVESLPSRIDMVETQSTSGTCTHDHDKHSTLCDEPFDVSCASLWGLLFGDHQEDLDTSQQSFFDSFLISRQITNFEKQPWELDLSKITNDPRDPLPFDRGFVGAHRSMHYDMAFGMKTAGTQTTHTTISKTQDSICVKSVSTNSGIPFANSFRTVVFTCIKNIPSKTLNSESCHY